MREALASALESRGAYRGARVLDLFAGTGALSFEALSRGASHVLAVDRDPHAIRLIAQSAKDLGLDAEARTARLDLLADPAGAVRKLSHTATGFNLVFADAPYSKIDAVPALFDALIAFGLLMPGAWVVIEHPATHDWRWPKGLAPEADYRYGQTGISLGVHKPEKGRQ